MKENVLNAVYALVDEIKNKTEYVRLLELKKIIAEDAKIIDLITIFNKTNKEFDEAAKYGTHHPDLLKIKTNLTNAKVALYTNEIVSEYKKLEKEIQSLLDLVSRKIANSVSPKIKSPNEIGLISKH